MHDDNFLAWPPSPQLAMTLFPYVRSAYLNLFRELLFPIEISLNRQIMGLPPIEPRQREQAAEQLQQRNGEGGVVGFLNGLIAALEADDDGEEHEHEHQAAPQLRVVDNEEEGNEGEMVLELLIEEVEELSDDETDDDEFQRLNNQNAREGRLGEAALDAALARDQPVPEVQQPAAEEHHQVQEEQQPVQEPAAAAAINIEVPPPAAVDNQPAQQDDHEAPQAPPARRPGLGSILSDISNAIVDTLLLPGISFAMGELIRLALPTSWTSAPRNSLFMRGPIARPGLFQQQWGRSLVGGCLFIVIKDVVRLYAKYRKVIAIGQRKVKNVNRRRR